MSDGVGCDVHASPYAGCSNKVVMSNPAVFFCGGAVATNFEFMEVLPDRVVVTGQSQISCTLHDDSVILQGETFYRSVERFSFYENTPTNPLRSGCSCIARNEINARSCCLRNTASCPFHRLRTDVVQTSNGYWFPEGVLADPFVSSDVNHPVGTVA